MYYSGKRDTRFLSFSNRSKLTEMTNVNKLYLLYIYYILYIHTHIVLTPVYCSLDRANDTAETTHTNIVELASKFKYTYYIISPAIILIRFQFNIIVTKKNLKDPLHNKLYYMNIIY